MILFVVYCAVNIDLCYKSTELYLEFDGDDDTFINYIVLTMQDEYLTKFEESQATEVYSENFSYIHTNMNLKYALRNVYWCGIEIMLWILFHLINLAFYDSIN